MSHIQITVFILLLFSIEEHDMHLGIFSERNSKFLFSPKHLKGKSSKSIFKAMNFEKQKRGVNVLNSKMTLLMNWFSTWDHLSLRAHWVIPGDISDYHGLGSGVRRRLRAII